MTQGGRLILEPCWEAGLLQWGKSSWQELLLRLDTDRPGFLSMRIAFYILALSALDNRLILNLYWEIIRYLRFPLLIERPVVDVESARGGPNQENVFCPNQRGPCRYLRAGFLRAVRLYPKGARRVFAGKRAADSLPVAHLPGSGPKCVTRWRPA